MALARSRAWVYFTCFFLARSFDCLAGVGVTNSQPVGGMCLQVVLDRGAALSSSSKLVYGIVSTNARQRTVFFPRPEYMMRVGLVDAKGEQLPLTPLGERFGRMFSQLTNYSPQTLERAVGGSNAGTPKFARLRADSYESHDLPAPRELFRIPAPGQYVLRLDVQVFEQVRHGTNFTYNLVKFPAVALPVVEDGVPGLRDGKP